jgi:hypothetical protein
MTNEESRRYEIIQDLKHGKIDGTEAAKKLHLSVRQTKRLKARVTKLGLIGIVHGNRGSGQGGVVTRRLQYGRGAKNRGACNTG